MESDFGRYLLTVEERDIDLLLMEEFHVKPEFVTWFCTQVGIKEAVFDGAWHSVSDQDGETDLLLRVASGGRRIGILIENKVAAPEQPEQAIRYHLRGARSREAGQYDEYVTCICAPNTYLNGLSGSVYDHKVPYEAVRDWYAAQSGARAAWRCKIMVEAIDQSRRGYTLVENESKTKFHRQYWEHLQRKHPHLIMREPAKKGSWSDWMVIKTADMPQRVTIIHKNNHACVDLTFEDTDVEKLLAVKQDWPDGILPRQRGGSTVLRISVPELKMEMGVPAQEAELEIALAAVHTLVSYCHILDRSPLRDRGEK